MQVDAASALNLEFALATGALTEEVTVTAEASLLQTDVAIRKTVEAKDIELLSFNGRNPIGVPALKAGVIGGSFNNAGAMSLTAGGFNINGGRSDEAVVYVDGAVATRTRSAGSMIGVQNADTVQEVQVLTANYMPEYGRASGGQIRFISKSGSNRYSGNASYFFRDDRLQANTWARNRSPNATENSGPAPFDQKQYGYAFGGPIPGEMFKDKLFFFGAQEWVDFFAVSTGTGDGAYSCDEAGRLQRAARVESVLQQPSDHPRSGYRAAVPRKHHPDGTPVTEWDRVDEVVSRADAGLPAGHGQCDFQQREPAGSAEGQHPARLPAEQQQPDHVPFSAIELEGHRCVPRNLRLWPAPNGNGRIGRRPSTGPAPSGAT